MEALCQMEPGSSDKSNESQMQYPSKPRTKKAGGGDFPNKIKKGTNSRRYIYTLSMVHAFYFLAVHRAFFPTIICAVALRSLGVHPLYISVPVHTTAPEQSSDHHRAKKQKQKTKTKNRNRNRNKGTKEQKTMADDDVDHDLLDFMRKAMGLDPPTTKPPLATKVLESAQFIFDNAIDVALDPDSVKAAAETIYRSMQEKSYSTSTWSEHELHPKEKNEDTIDFIFTMDILNFSFWSDFDDQERRFAVNYGGKRWTGYWSLVALLRRALDEGLFSIAIVCDRDKLRNLEHCFLISACA